jgi:hypothetical protein
VVFGVRAQGEGRARLLAAAAEVGDDRPTLRALDSQRLAQPLDGLPAAEAGRARESVRDVCSPPGRTSEPAGDGFYAHGTPPFPAEQ